MRRAEGHTQYPGLLGPLGRIAGGFALGDRDQLWARSNQPLWRQPHGSGPDLAAGRRVAIEIRQDGTSAGKPTRADSFRSRNDGKGRFFSVASDETVAKAFARARCRRHVQAWKVLITGQLARPLRTRSSAAQDLRPISSVRRMSPLPPKRKSAAAPTLTPDACKITADSPLIALSQEAPTTWGQAVLQESR